MMMLYCIPQFSHKLIGEYQAKSTDQIELGNKQPTMDKLMQLIGIVLLYLVGLSGSEDI